MTCTHNPLPLDLYCDTPLSTLLDPETVASVRDTPLTGIRVYAEDSSGKRVVERDDLDRVAETYAGLSIRSVFWPRPVFGREYALWVAEMSWYGSPVYDVEHQATKERDRLVLSRRLEGIRSLWNPTVTTHPGHPEASPGALVGLGARPMSFETQAYSTSSRARVYPTRGRPGAWQKYCVEDAVAARGDVPEVALALYRQTSIRGLSPVDAMATAFSEALAQGAPAVSFWSLKHLLSSRYARAFMTERLGELLPGEEDTQ